MKSTLQECSLSWEMGGSGKEINREITDVFLLLYEMQICGRIPHSTNLLYMELFDFKVEIHKEN